MKILIVSNIFPPEIIGGAEIVAFNQAIELFRRGHKVYVVCGSRSALVENYVVKVESFFGLVIYRIKLPQTDVMSDSNNFSNPVIDQLILKILLEEKIDVVHAHNLSGLSVNLTTITNECGIPSVATLHDYWPICPRNTLINSLGLPCKQPNCDRFCMNSYSDGNKRKYISARQSYIRNKYLQFNTLISPSKYLIERFVDYGYPKNKLIYLSNGISIKESLEKEKIQETYFLYIGNIGWHKGYDIILKSINILKQANINIRLKIIGTGEDLPILNKLINDYSLMTNVLLLGQVDNSKVQHLLRTARALISGSRWPENQPVSILESFLNKTPVIAPNIGGIPELVKDQVTGLIYKTNSSSDLAESIKKYSLNPSLALEHGRNAYLMVRNEHALETTISSLELIYKSLVKQFKQIH